MQTRSEIVVADPRWVVPLYWLGFPVLGAGAGWGLTAVSDWVAGLDWAPLRGPFRLVASIPEPQATIGAVAIGIVAGLILAGMAAAESVAVTVAGDRVEIRRGGEVRRVDRGTVGAVFLDGRELVLLGPDTAELARQKTDLPARRIRDAFRGHGYPWLDGGDPHRDEFRRWVEDMPGLPPGAEALFRARTKALAGNDKEDAAQLRTELAKLGLVVRDEKKRQFWRYAGR
jgi:hypothetical protein